MTKSVLRYYIYAYAVMLMPDIYIYAVHILIIGHPDTELPMYFKISL